MAVGLTAARLSLGPALLEFLEKNPIPVVVTPMAKGLIPPGHPCYSGVLFHARSDLLKQVYRDSDLVIGFGYDPVEFNYESWMPDVPLVSINTVAVDLPVKAEALQFVGDLREGLQLADASLGRLSADSLDAVRNAREEFRKAFVSSADGFSPVTALRVLREELPAETIMTADVGSHLHLLGQYWDPAGPGNLIMTNGWSSMGFGLPAAIAAQIQHPERPVVCLTGDGGILMCLGELATASRCRLPLTVVVFADRQLNLIGLKEGWRGTGNFASSLYEGDLFGAENILGVKVIRAGEAECLKLAVRDALNDPGPVVIETVVDPSDYERLILPA